MDNYTHPLSLGNSELTAPENASITPNTTPPIPPVVAPQTQDSSNAAKEPMDKAGVQATPSKPESNIQATLRRLPTRRNFLDDMIRMATGREPLGTQGDGRYRRYHDLPPALTKVLIAILRLRRNRLAKPNGLDPDGNLVSWSTLQVEAKATRNQVRFGLQELEQAGIIVRTRRRHMDGRGGWASKLYVRLNTDRLMELASGVREWRKGKNH